MQSKAPENNQGLKLPIGLVQHGVWQNWGRTLLPSALATWQQLFGQDKQRWAFGCYLVHLFFNGAAVPGLTFFKFQNFAYPYTLVANFSVSGIITLLTK